jgi:hypothetical protein
MPERPAATIPTAKRFAQRLSERRLDSLFAALARRDCMHPAAQYMYAVAALS